MGLDSLFRLVFSLAGASSQGFFKLLSSAPKGHATFAQLLPHVQSLLGPDCFLRVVVRFTWKILTIETIFDSLFLGAFPEDASFPVLPAYSQHAICPAASQASVVIKPESWT
jgi:hypothetical protein